MLLAVRCMSDIRIFEDGQDPEWLIRSMLEFSYDIHSKI